MHRRQPRLRQLPNEGKGSFAKLSMRDRFAERQFKQSSQLIAFEIPVVDLRFLVEKQPCMSTCDETKLLSVNYNTLEDRLQSTASAAALANAALAAASRL